jgi:hypothetical protein
MATRSWIGGGTNNIYAASNWSPSGAPGFGDTLYMVSGTANMHGGTLSADTLDIGTRTSFTTPGSATVNLSGGAVLSAHVADAAFTEQQVVFNIAGKDTLNLQEDASNYATTSIIENIAPHSTLRGTVVGSGHNVDITIDGADSSSRFANTGASFVSDGVLRINAGVIGVGSFSASFFAGIEFIGSVGHGQTVNAEGADTITLDKPGAFKGLVNFQGGPSNTVDLVGITNADSYSYHNDMLSLFHGGQVVDTLRFAAGGNAFQVTENAAGVQISGSAYGSGNPPPAGTTILPAHMFGA